MCGIAGLYDPSATEAEVSDIVSKMNQSLHHRGPDGHGYYTGKADAGHIGLGHRRLSIIDLAGGDQPIFNEDGSIVIVFNGEIYNYKEIRQALLKRGHQFKTASDTEVIVHLYEEQGVNCVDELNGMFAFALWDSRRQRLLLARDRMGEKPLYYSFNNNRLVFASELKALIEDPKQHPEICMQAVDDFLAYGYVPAPRSIFSGIYKLPAAHCLVFEQGNMSIARYWKNTIDSFTLSEVDALELLKERLTRSVNIRLRSDVPVGAFLSGGIDSSLIVALAAQQSSNTLTTFSVGFSEADFDELHFARQIAERYHTNHHEIVLSEIDTDLFPKIVDHFDEPFADPSAIPTYYVTREASKRLKVCLSGDGGDELFCGYTRYKTPKAEKLASAIPASIRAPLFGGAAHLVPDHFRGKGTLRRMAATDHVYWQRALGVFDALERRSLFRSQWHDQIDHGSWLFEPYFNQTALDLTSRQMLADQHTYLCDDILVKVDRNSMWHSLEVRVPLLDHTVVELANSFPLALKYKNQVQKYPLKQLLKGLVPDEILTREKKGFGLPIKHWLKDQFYDYSQSLLTSESSLCAEYFDQRALVNLIEKNKTGKRDLSRRIWSLMWFEQWLRNLKQKGIKA